MSEVNVRNEGGIDPVSLQQTLERNEAEVARVLAQELGVTADTFESGGLGKFLQSQGYEPVQKAEGENGGGTFIIHGRDNGFVDVSELQKLLEANGTGIKLQSPQLKIVIAAARRDITGLLGALGHEVR